MGFEDLVSKMNERNQFRKVCVDQGVIDSVVFYSKKSYPNEFLAMLDGHVKDNVLYITGLLFLPGERSHTSASFNDWMIPPNQKKWGSVHSHPGNNANPSHADLMTFSKHGPFHMIVCEPYSLETMKAYNAYGEPVAFEVGNFPDENKDLMLEDLKQIKEEIDEMDGEELSPSFFDLDKDNLVHHSLIWIRICPTLMMIRKRPISIPMNLMKAITHITFQMRIWDLLT